MQVLSLLELNQRIREQIRLSFESYVWVRAEISELHENAGHGYLELIEKDEAGNRLVAKTRANCWANTFRMLKPYFENATGETLRAGLKVLIAVTVEYHELYSISLSIRDIDPAFTVGEMAMQRLKIIRQLEADGVIDMNKQHELSLTPQRIAVISSPTAAGYGDFMDQLTRNAERFQFYTKLFPAVMQGEQAPASIISALDKIAEHQDKFDMVVIIRGGGAAAELACFDNYELAFNCAQFPLPILTGIGHDRDESIVDMVAHTRAKTPTAAAEFLISCLDEAFDNIISLKENFAYLADSIIEQEQTQLLRAINNLPRLSIQKINNQQYLLSSKIQSLRRLAEKQIAKQNHRLDLIQSQLQFSSPEIILKRGYSLTLKNNCIVRNTSQLEHGDRITTRLSDGTIESVIL